MLRSRTRRLDRLIVAKNSCLFQNKNLSEISKRKKKTVLLNVFIHIFFFTVWSFFSSHPSVRTHFFLAFLSYVLFQTHARSLLFPLLLMRGIASLFYNVYAFLMQFIHASLLRASFKMARCFCQILIKMCGFPRLFHSLFNELFMHGPPMYNLYDILSCSDYINDV